MAYITQADVETYLQITFNAKQIALFAAILPNMAAAVDLYCNRSWSGSNPITETFDGNTDTFFVSNPSISSIQSITIGGTTYDLSYAYNYKTHIKLSLNQQSLLLSNPLGYQSVVIIYNSTATTPPLPVKQALIEWMARKIQTSPDSNKEAENVQTGTVSVRYTKDMIGGVPDFVAMVLHRYRLSPLDHF